MRSSELGWLGKELCREVFVPALLLLAQPSFASLGSVFLTTWQTGSPGRWDPFPLHSFTLSSFSLLPGYRIFSELNSTEMHLIIVQGMNLPAPPGSPRATPIL